MPMENAAAGIGFAIAAIWTVAAMVAFDRILGSSSRSTLVKWAEREGLSLVSLERRRFLAKGPFWWRTSQYQTVHRVVALDKRGQERTGLVRCGSYFLGLLVDQVDARWDDENAPDSATSATSPVKSLWDRDIDGP